jgi:hypothetical protein
MDAAASNPIMMISDGALAAARRGRLEKPTCCKPSGNTQALLWRIARMLGRNGCRPYRWLGTDRCWLNGGLSAHAQAALFSRNLLRANCMNASYDCSKACEDLGFIPRVYLDEGMSKVTTWLAEENLFVANDKALSNKS